MQDLVARLNAICDEQPYVTAWYVKNLITGQEADRDGNVAFPSGSTRKTSILMAVLRAVNQGRLDLNAPIVYEERLRQGVMSGTFKYLTPGFTISLRDALVQMIIVSDNVCTAMVMERISLEEINQFCHGIGMRNTVHRNSVPRPDMPPDHKLDEVTTISACDQGLLYDLILKGCSDHEAAQRLGCTPQQCAFAIEVLSWQKLRTKMASLLPSDTKVAHKGGTGKRGRMDGGIVFRNEQPLFILTGYTDQVPWEMPDGMPGYVSAFNTLGRLARACWDGIGNDR
ncbi:serine hydrolase [Herbaspirillum sp. DW155]|uniref:serine hydrolase n=1 Tax=Herbaspirillum sp. DW155 TaxID=3095609 RepID=UPI0030912AA1|nr:serine hydrolase [Herbaspirillum sp. DW155]